MDKRNIKGYVRNSAVVLLAVFSLLLLYVVYLQVWQADELVKSPLNKRNAAMLEDIRQGSILAAGGEKLAYTDDNGQRIYPYGAVMAPITGYEGKKIGSAGIEGKEGRELSGLSDSYSFLGPAAQLFMADKGNDVKLTIDVRAQEAASSALGNRRGAVVVMDAATGAVLAMVSKPAYDPATVEENWERLSAQTDSPLLNRAVQGLYPPGSTIKPLIAAAALKNKVTDTAEIFPCSGELDLGGGYVLHESHGAVHGKVNLEQALVHSCNITFATLAMRLDSKDLADAFNDFGFNLELGGDIGSEPARLPEFAALNEGDKAQVGIGQGTMLVTPLQMAMLADAFANNGTIMRPYLVDEVITPNGVIIKKQTAEKIGEAVSSTYASLIDKYMLQVVEEGTGSAAQIQGVRVTGKTGTAENSGGEDHAWFIGSAELPERKIVFAIIVENSGGGGSQAAPIAKKVILSLLQ